MAKEVSRGHSAMGGGHKSKSKSKGGKHPHEIHIRHGKSGGFIVRHSHKPDADTGIMPEEDEHVLPDQASLLQHVQDNTDSQPAMQAPSPDQGGGAPMPQGGPAPQAAAPGM